MWERGKLGKATRMGGLSLIEQAPIPVLKKFDDKSSLHALEQWIGLHLNESKVIPKFKWKPLHTAWYFAPNASSNNS